MVVTFRVRPVMASVAGAMLASLSVLTLATAWQADAASSDAETTFVPFMPGCRFLDTRQIGQGGPIGPGQTRTFTAHGTSGGCTVPADAVALSFNLTVDGRTAPNSFITVWGDGSNPGTSVLNPALGEPPTANSVTTDLTSAGQFNVYNDAGLVHVIIDLTGYHTNASLAELTSRLTAAETAVAALDGQRPFAVTTEETPSSPTELTATPTAFAAVTVNAPVAGHVTIGSTALVSNDLSGGAVACAIFETPLPAAIPLTTPSFQQFQANSNGESASLSGTRTFEIDAGANVTYALGCIELGTAGSIRNRNLTAVFTPEP